MKCKNCSEDISDDFARNVSKHVVSAMPNQQQQQVQERIKEVTKHPPEMKFRYCKDCDKMEANPDYRKPAVEYNNCDAKLNASRKSCVFCGSDDIDKQGLVLIR